MWLTSSFNNYVNFVPTWISLSLALSFFVDHKAVEAVSTFPKVLVISVDGFRPDYVEDCLTPTIVKLRSAGVYAPFMKNVFPTKTFPNHHSIATGVFPDVHGVLDSSVYTSKDGCSNRTLVGYSEELYHYSNDVLPIWTLNQLAGKGRHSGVLMWPGGDFPYGCKKTMPTFHEKWDVHATYRNRVDTIISWFLNKETPANLVMLYLEEPDYHGHAFGIDSPEVRNQIKRLDNTFDYIGQQLKEHGLDELITVFVLSDHGMITQNQKNIIDLNKYVDNATYVVAGSSPVLQVFPKEGREKGVLSGLRRAYQDHKNAMDVYTREEIPSIWHYAENNRTPPILVVAKEGYAFQDFNEVIELENRRYDIEPNPTNKYGIHGYSNEYPSMHPFFFAWGPLLKSGVVLEPFNTTELYPLWAHLLSLDVQHDVHSSANLSMLRSSSDYFKQIPPAFKPTTDTSQAPTNSTPSSNFSPSSGGAPSWTYWFSGLIAVMLLIIITGFVAHFCRDLNHRMVAQPIIPQNQRNFVENQHLLVSESEDELHL